MNELELRYSAVAPSLLSREDDDEEDRGKIVSGYVAVFNSTYRVIDGRGREFLECVRSGAFSDCLAGGPDMRALFNHDPSQLLARTRSGTMRVWQDQRGLAFQLTLPDTELGRQIRESIRRGDLDGASMGFLVRGDDGERWGNDERGLPFRELLAVDVVDVSLATFPASQRTSIQVRSDNRLLLTKAKLRLWTVEN